MPRSLRRLLLSQRSKNKNAMTPKDFCYWLQGYFEIAKPVVISKEVTKTIREHLGLVFTKVTPGKREKPRACAGKRRHDEIEYCANRPKCSPVGFNKMSRSQKARLAEIFRTPLAKSS